MDWEVYNSTVCVNLSACLIQQGGLVGLCRRSHFLLPWVWTANVIFTFCWLEASAKLNSFAHATGSASACALRVRAANLQITKSRDEIGADYGVT